MKLALLASLLRIAFFGPDDPNAAVGGSTYAGLVLGLEGEKAEVVSVWSENPWGTGVANLAKTLHTSKFDVVIGGVDGASTHLAEQVVAKTRTPMLDPASTDRSVNQARVPWVFSLLPDDVAIAEVIVDRLAAEPRRSFALLVGTDHDSRALANELEKAMNKRNLVPARRIDVEGDTLDASLLEGAERVVILAEPGASARLLGVARSALPVAEIVGGPAFGHRAFRAATEGSPIDVFFVDLTDGSIDREFERRFAARFGYAPDAWAAAAFDAARLAVRSGGHPSNDRSSTWDSLGRRDRRPMVRRFKTLGVTFE